MTLFIALILLSMIGAEWPLYAIAALVWVAHLIWHGQGK